MTLEYYGWLVLHPYLGAEMHKLSKNATMKFWGTYFSPITEKIKKNFELIFECKPYEPYEVIIFLLFVLSFIFFAFFFLILSFSFLYFSLFFCPS